MARNPVSAVLAALLLQLPAVGGEPEYRHGMSLLHDLKYPADFTHFEYANPDAPKGGRIVLSTTMNIVNLSGQQGPELPNAPGYGRTQDRLFMRTGDELCGIYGWLVEGVALSPDRKTLRLRLHDSARWHDGTPITTRDVRFSFDALMRRPFGKRYFESWIERLEVAGPHDLVIHHRRVFTNANLAALVWFRIRPAHYWEGRNPEEATLVPPVGSGPYRIREFDRGHIVYERVEDYWGRDLPIHRGRYNFDEIRYEVYRDATVAREGFRKGLFDIHFETDIGHWRNSYDIPALERGWMRRGTRDINKFIGMQTAIAFNTDRERFRDVRVREALAVALDFEWQNRVFRLGSQQRALSYFSRSRFAATGTPSGEELRLLSRFRDQLPERVFLQPFALPVSEGRGHHRPALAHARTLLAEAGWRVESGRLVNARGRQFRLDLLTNNPAHRRVLLPYVEALKLLGIDVRVRLVDSLTAVNFRRQRDFDAYVRGHDFLNPPVGELRSYFGSDTADLELSSNIPGIRDSIVDALIEEAERAETIEAAAVALKALDRVLLWGFYHVPLHAIEEERFLWWDKFERPEHEAVARYEYLVGSSLRILDSWWFEPEKAERLVSVGK